MVKHLITAKTIMRQGLPKYDEGKKFKLLEFIRREGIEVERLE